MTRIAPQALACDPVGVDEHSRLGVTLCGLGGLDVEVIDRLNNRFHGRPERIGLYALYVDSVRADGYARPSGPFGLSFSAAESRFLASDADYAVVLEDIAAGNPPGWEPPVTPAQARSILTDKLPMMIGFGGQPVSSFIAARLAWAGWEQRVDANLRQARTVNPAAEPLTVVIASLYGGTGIGHLPLFLQQLKELRQENVVVFVALPSQAEGLLQPAQVPDAHARGIAGLRGLLRPGLYKHLFLVGSGNRVLSRDPRGSAIEVIASTIAAWLENPEAFRAEQATWLGQDFQGATTAERLSTLGAAEVVFPAETLARQQSCDHAAQAWKMVTEIGPTELNRATNDGEKFAWSNPMTAALDEVTRAPSETSAVAFFDKENPQVTHGKVRQMFGWFSVALPDTEPIDPRGVWSALDGQQRRMMSEDLVRLANKIVQKESEDVKAGRQRLARATRCRLELACFATFAGMTSAAHDYETVIPLDQAPPVAELAQRAGRHERIRLVAAGGDAVVVLSADEHQANIDDIVMLAEALQANSGGGISMTEQCDLDDVADAMDAVGSAVVAAVDAAIMRRSRSVPSHEYVAALHAEAARRATTG